MARRSGIIFLCCALILLNSGCQNAKTRAGEGAIAGGVLGAAAGGIIGHQSHHGGEGAAIGAAAGVLAGAIIGSQINKPAQGPQPAPAVSAGNAGQPANLANPNQMSVQQIAQLGKDGVNEDVIIDKIRLSNSKFNLTSADIEYLKGQGVSQKVIDIMQGK